jgi:hypothetical protein
MALSESRTPNGHSLILHLGHSSDWEDEEDNETLCNEVVDRYGGFRDMKEGDGLRVHICHKSEFLSVLFGKDWSHRQTIRGFRSDDGEVMLDTEKLDGADKRLYAKHCLFDSAKAVLDNMDIKIGGWFCLTLSPCPQLTGKRVLYTCTFDISVELGGDKITESNDELERWLKEGMRTLHVKVWDNVPGVKKTYTTNVKVEEK